MDADAWEFRCINTKTGPLCSVMTCCATTTPSECQCLKGCWSTYSSMTYISSFMPGRCITVKVRWILQEPNVWKTWCWWKGHRGEKNKWRSEWIGSSGLSESKNNKKTIVMIFSEWTNVTVFLNFLLHSRTYFPLSIVQIWHFIDPCLIKNSPSFTVLPPSAEAEH